jgi:uncharacterized membrane protein HdeD (DUF308 family)
MSTLSDTPRPADLSIEPLRRKSGWIVALGVVYVIAGLIALASVVLATVVSVLVVGVMMIISGVSEVINAFQIRTWGKFILWLLLGVVYIIAGLIVFESPLLTAVLLTAFVGISLIVSGIMRIMLGFGMQQATPWLWVVLSGVASILIGAVILAHWPGASLFVLGLFLGVDLLIAGIGWIAVGLGLRAAAH